MVSSRRSSEDFDECVSNEDDDNSIVEDIDGAVYMANARLRQDQLMSFDDNDMRFILEREDLLMGDKEDQDDDLVSLKTILEQKKPQYEVINV